MKKPVGGDWAHLNGRLDRELLIHGWEEQDCQKKKDKGERLGGQKKGNK